MQIICDLMNYSLNYSLNLFDKNGNLLESKETDAENLGNIITQFAKDNNAKIVLIGNKDIAEGFIDDIQTNELFTYGETNLEIEVR